MDGKRSENDDIEHYNSDINIFRWQNHTTWGGWMSPFSEDEEKNFLEKCNSSGSAAENVGWAWIHNQQKFRLTDREILEKLTKIKKETLLTQMEYFKRIEIEALNED
jgi:hypothetical protein